MAKMPTKSKKKQQNIFQKLVSKATATRRSLFVTGLIGVLLFSSVGYYIINRSSAAIDGAAVCGSGYGLKYSKPLYNSKLNKSGGAQLSTYGKTVSNGYRYCAIVISLSGYGYGTAKPMTASFIGGQSDSGNFQYYAGPVYYTVPSGFTGCIYSHGSASWGGYTYSGNQPIGWC